MTPTTALHAIAQDLARLEVLAGCDVSQAILQSGVMEANARARSLVAMVGVDDAVPGSVDLSEFDETPEVEPPCWPISQVGGD